MILAPKASHRLLDGRGDTDAAWYRWVGDVTQIANNAVTRDILAQAIADALGEITGVTINGSSTISVVGGSVDGYNISLRELADSGVGASLVKTTFDKYGRRTGTEAAYLDDLADVDAPTPADGDVLAWNDTDSVWEPTAPATGTGDVVGPASATDNALARFDTTTGKLLQDSDVLVTDTGEISGYLAHLNAQTGTTYTLDVTDAGKIVQLTNASAIALTAANTLPAGFACTIVQGGAGQVTIASTGSGTVVNRQSHTKTAGQNAMVALYVRSNSGTNAVFVLGGDTSA